MSAIMNSFATFNEPIKAMAAAYGDHTRRLHGEKWRKRRGGMAKPRKHTASSMESDYWQPKVSYLLIWCLVVGWLVICRGSEISHLIQNFSVHCCHSQSPSHTGIFRVSGPGFSGHRDKV